ncbi:integrase family protein [Pectobacterium polaris]|uniref:integrase family protein n=2 Tax=Pectobacterium polaris TaxID=2042057 RepID=UPI0020C60487|nr:integrase family protein [Pectobacterium polaris]
MPLTDAKIRSTKSTNKPIKLADGGGLYLEVRSSGSKLWCYRYRIAGKENIFALGEYPTLRADGDPAAAPKGAIRSPKVEHHKPLSRTEIADFMQALSRYGGYRTTVIALKLMLLTFVRTVELRKAEWREFDLDGASGEFLLEE